MAIKAIIFDLEGTLVEKRGQSHYLATGIEEMLNGLDERDVCYAVISNKNRNYINRILSKLDLEPDLLLGSDDVDKKKGGKQYVEAVMQEFDVDSTELIYIGDDDRTDLREASNSKIWYFHANWSGKPSGCPFRFNEPWEVIVFWDIFFKKVNLWFWKLNTEDILHRGVEVYALIEFVRKHWEHVSADLESRELSEGAFVGAKYNDRRDYGNFYLFHLLSSLYMDGIIQKVDVITSWPPHQAFDHNVKMDPFLKAISWMFRDFHSKDILIRYRNSIKSATARSRGARVGFQNQIATVAINHEHARRIINRNILVVDDFTTEGYSFEWSRNLFLSAGAKRVINLAWGKTKTSQGVERYRIKIPISSETLSPIFYKPNENTVERDIVSEDAFRTTIKRGLVNRDAIRELISSFRIWRKYLSQGI